MTLWATLLVVAPRPCWALPCCGTRERAARPGARQLVSDLSVFRNTPLLVQLLFWYFVIPALLPEAWCNGSTACTRWRWAAWCWWRWPSFQFLAALVGLVAYSTAYVGEDIRSGLRGVPASQRPPRWPWASRLRRRCATWCCRRRCASALPPLFGQYLEHPQEHLAGHGRGAAGAVVPRPPGRGRDLEDVSRSMPWPRCCISPHAVLELLAQRLQRRRATCCRGHDGFSFLAETALPVWAPSPRAAGRRAASAAAVGRRRAAPQGWAWPFGVLLVWLQGPALAVLSVVLAFVRCHPGADADLLDGLFSCPVLFGIEVPGVFSVMAALALVGGAYLAHGVAAGIRGGPAGQWTEPSAGLHALGCAAPCGAAAGAAHDVCRRSSTSGSRWSRTSSLAYIVGLPELSFLATQVNARVMVHPAEVLLCVGAVYWAAVQRAGRRGAAAGAGQRIGEWPT